MSKAALLLSIALLVTVLATLPGMTADDHFVNEFCPVTTDERAEPDIWVDYEGRRIHFCCKGCRKDFLTDPASYISNLAASEESNVAASIGAGAASADSAAVHDHGHDHDVAVDARQPEQISGIKRAVKFAGKFHPLVVHFPIALILMALLAEGLLTATGRTVFAGCGRFCILAGAAGAVMAAGQGWMAGEFAKYPGDLAVVLFRHRWLGVSVAVLTVLTAGAGEMRERHQQRKWDYLFRIMLVLCAILVGLTGHFGATLIYGLDYFSW